MGQLQKQNSNLSRVTASLPGSLSKVVFSPFSSEMESILHPRDSTEAVASRFIPPVPIIFLKQHCPMYLLRSSFKMCSIRTLVFLGFFSGYKALSKFPCFVWFFFPQKHSWLWRCKTVIMAAGNTSWTRSRDNVQPTITKEE